MTRALDHIPATSPSLPQTLRTERLTLRPFAASDLEAYVAYYAGARTDGVGGAKPRHQAVERFLTMAGQWAIRGFGRYAMDLQGRAIGHVGPMQQDSTDPIEMTWTLWDAADEGKGFATEAARAVLSAWTGPRLLAHVDRENAASLRVVQRLGFVEDTTATSPPWIPNGRVFLAPESLPE